MRSLLKFIPIVIFISCLECPNYPEKDSYLDQLYQAAIKDTKNPEPAEVMNLSPISEAIPKQINDTIHYKMATLVSEEYIKSYRDSLKLDSIYTVSCFDMWLTIVPKLKNICTDIQFFGVDQKDIRVKQILGLPYEGDYSYVVELWASALDIKRPCRDCEITDTICSLDFPANTDSLYRKWFNEKIADTYSSENKFPFTQLGYTYDWGDPKSDFGLSEFVILGKLKPAEVKIEAIYSLSDYCNPEKDTLKSQCKTPKTL